MKKTALITGASSGLGLSLAKLFAKDGCDLVITARNEEKLAKIKNEIESTYGTEVSVFSADLSTADAAEKIYNFTSEKGIFVDILVNNAGFGDFGEFFDCDMQKQTDMINVNITSLTKLCRLYVEPMVKNGKGKILNMASIAAFQAGPLMSVYYATKAYVLSLSEALSAELKGTGVTVTAVCPGPTKTGFESAADLGNSGLFKNLKNATADEVALYGYKSLNKGKVIAIHGVGNRLTVFASKLAPRALVRRAVYSIQKPCK